MSRLQEFWAMLNSPIVLQPRRPPVPVPAALTGEGHLAAAIGGLRGIPNKRESTLGLEEGFAGAVTRLEGVYPGYPNDSRRRIIRLMRWLTQRDDDMNGSLRDQIAIANPGHTLEFVGGKRAVQAAQQEIQSFADRIFPEGGGLDGLNNNQVAEIIRSGATSLEWFPLASRRGVQDVAVVQAEDIYIQRLDNGLVYTQQSTVAQPVQLDNLTYRYLPILTDGANPYGIPLFIAALEAADRKTRLTASVDRVVDMMRVSAFVSATFPVPQPAEVGLASPTDPRYPARVKAYFQEAAKLIYDDAPKGLFVGPKGAEVNVTNLTQSLTGVVDLVKENNRRLWTATRTLPFLRGHMDATTEALAKVAYPMVEAEAANIQMVLARQIEFGLNLHLRLKGIPVTVFVRFEQAQSAFALANAQAELTRMQTDQIGKEVFGPGWWPKASQRWDVSEKDADQAPGWWRGAATVPPNIPILGGDTAASSTITYDRQARRYRQVGGLRDLQTA